MYATADNVTVLAYSLISALMEWHLYRVPHVDRLKLIAFFYVSTLIELKSNNLKTSRVVFFVW